MHKLFLTASAILVVSTSVHAQSTVTVYGSFDQFIEAANNGQTTTHRLSSGGAIASRLGFRGSEDLGSGMRALFTLEHDFQGDLGTAVGAAKFWNRQSTVGLVSNDVGTLTAGRQYTPHFIAMASMDPAGFYMGSALNYFAFPGFPVSVGKPAGGINGTGADSLPRRDNSVLYVSPAWAEVQLKLFANAGEGADARVRNVAIHYNGAALFGAVSYLNERTTYVTGNTDKVTLAVVGYDFGVVKPVAIFISRRGEATVAPSVDAYQLGASVPMGAGVLIATFAKLKNKLDDGYSSAGFGLRYDHVLSKRTKLYAGFTGIRNNAKAAFTISGGGSSSPGQALAAPGADPRSSFFGLSHTF